MDEHARILFPDDGDGRRSTSALGRDVVTDALRATDPAGAAAAERETSWRTGYLEHVRQLTVAGMVDRGAALAIARDGLDAVHRRMIWADGADERPASALLDAAPDVKPGTEVVQGTADPEEELSVPLRGQRLRGDALREQLDRWVQGGVVMPSFAEAIGRVIDHPEWLRLPGRTVVVLGAGAEMGPLPALLRWGATVAGIDLPRPELWSRVLDGAASSAGTLLVPAAEQGPGEDAPLAERAGLDLIRQAPAAAEWITALDRAPVIGNYVYADGATHVRVATAVDLLTQRVLAARDDVAVAFLATPTDVFAVPADVVARSVEGYEQRGTAGRLLARPLRTVSRGRLLRRQYAPEVDPGICDALVPQQGPNYALAKRIHRWRAAVARAEGVPTSMHVAPATRTRSVTKNRALAAAYAGAHRFGVEVFEPGTTNVLMAALLVHDLVHGPGEAHAHVWEDEAHAAAHGGLWTCPYAPRSALGLAALLGVGGARG